MLLELPCPDSYMLLIRFTVFVLLLELGTGGVVLLLALLFPSKLFRDGFRFLVRLFLF